MLNCCLCLEWIMPWGFSSATGIGCEYWWCHLYRICTICKGRRWSKEILSNQLVEVCIKSCRGNSEHLLQVCPFSYNSQIKFCRHVLVWTFDVCASVPKFCLHFLLTLYTYTIICFGPLRRVHILGHRKFISTGHQAMMDKFLNTFCASSHCWQFTFHVRAMRGCTITFP
jgi:hypothetical protein